MKESLISSRTQSTAFENVDYSALDSNTRPRTPQNRRRVIGATLVLLVVVVVIVVVVVLVGKSNQGGGSTNNFLDAPMTDQLRSQIRSLRNLSVDPCQDFYSYACGTWMSNNPPNGTNDPNMYSFNQIADIVQTEYTRVLQENFDFVATVLNACLNATAIDNAGWLPLLNPWFQKINQINSPAQAMSLLGEMQSNGLAADAFFGWTVHSDLPTARISTFSFRLSGNVVNDPLEYDTYGNVILPLFQLYQENNIITNATEAMLDVIAVENWILQNIPSIPNSIQELTQAVSISSVSQFEQASGLPLSAYLNKLSPSHSINNVQYFSINAFQALGEEFMNTSSLVLSPSQVQNYFRWRLVYGMLDNLPSPFRDIATNLQQNYFPRSPGDSLVYYNPNVRTWPSDYMRKRNSRATQLLGTDSFNRTLYCNNYIQTSFSNLYQHEWVIEYFPAANKVFATKLVQMIYASMGDRIRSATWLDDSTRQAAIQKWSNIIANIGYDAVWTDYVGLDVSGIMFSDATVVAQFFNGLNLIQCDQPVQRNKFSNEMPIIVQNAFYDPTSNTINMLAGLMFPPMFSYQMPMILNLASYGMVIGHEMTHGFDNNGRNYDSYGAYHDWWSNYSDSQFLARSTCLVDEYSSYVVVENFTLNGQQTLGENIADNGGIEVAYQAYQAFVTQQGGIGPLMDEYTNDQLFFLYYAQNWCATITPQTALDLMSEDVHSPAKYRVVGPLSNFPAFAKAWKCDGNTPMGRSLTPARCQVW